MAAVKANKKAVIFIVLFVFFLGAFFAHKSRAPKRGYSDFHCYYTAGKRILAGDNIYVIKDSQVAEFRYSPLFAVIMSGLAILDEDSADSLWFTLNYLLLAVTFFFAFKLAGFFELSAGNKALFSLLALLGAGRFIFHNFDTGQANILMLASLICGLNYAKENKCLPAASLMALAVMIKYTPVIFLPYFILRKRIKLAVFFAIFIAVYLLLPAVCIGLENNASYIKNMFSFLTQSSILEKTTLLDPKNQSLLSLVHRACSYYTMLGHYSIPPMPFKINLSDSAINMIFSVFALIMYLSILWKPKRSQFNAAKDHSFYENIDYSLLFICVILFNLNAWIHNYIFLLLPYLILIFYLIKTRFSDPIALGILLCSYLLNSLTLKACLGKAISYKAHFYSPHTFAALILFFLLLRIKFSRRKYSYDQERQGYK
ncbi:MAG: glycosyltransferase family 87 protein [Candidatus Omnitrophota bacterium]